MPRYLQRGAQYRAARARVKRVFHRNKAKCSVPATGPARGTRRPTIIVRASICQADQQPRPSPSSSSGPVQKIPVPRR